MALKLWFPLNNNIKNIGLTTCSISSVPSITPSYVAGPTNNALSFNGSTYWQSQNITLGNEATIACWSKTSANGKMTWVLASDGYAYLNLFESSIYTLNTGDSNNNPFRNSSNSNINVIHDNAWHHFAVTFGNSVAKLYIDGAYAGTALTFKSPKTSNKAIKIGGGFSNAHSYDWNGAIADFRVYDNCLGEEDIQRIYANSTKMLQVNIPFSKDHRNVGLKPVLTTSAGTFTMTDDTNFVRCGKFGTATGYVKIPHDIFKQNIEMSMAFFVKFNTWNTSWATPIGIFKNSNAWTGNTFTFLRNATNSNFAFSISNGTSSTNANCNTGTLSLNTWYHFCCVYKDKTMKLYQDGELIKTYNPTFDPSFTAATLAIVGASTTGGSYQTDTEMSSVKLYNVALSEDDVKRIYNETPDVYRMISFLKFLPGQYINTNLAIAINDQTLTKATLYYETGQTTRDLMGWGTGGGCYWGVTTASTWEWVSTYTNADITQLNNITFSIKAPNVGTYTIGQLNNHSTRTKYIKSFQISINGVVQRDFYACYRKSDGKYGMYDMITKTFYTNAGTGGDFTGIK